MIISLVPKAAAVPDPFLYEAGITINIACLPN
jgi:hypothetical protein